MANLFNLLGIRLDYGIDPQLPRYKDATELEEVEANFVGRIQFLIHQTAESWRVMKQDALSEGIELFIVSGFRSIVYQTEIFQNKLASGQTIETILKVNAAPGFSQHHTGMAIDITTPGTQPLTEGFESSDAFAWLQKYADKYEFNLPFGHKNEFGSCYEPWHWSQISINTD